MNNKLQAYHRGLVCINVSDMDLSIQSTGLHDLKLGGLGSNASTLTLLHILSARHVTDVTLSRTGWEVLAHSSGACAILKMSHMRRKAPPYCT